MTRETSEQTPIWCGIHYLLYLRLAGAEEDCARFSLFQTEYSPAGGGHAGFLYIDAESFPSAPANGVYTDNPDMAEWMYNRMYRDSDNPVGGVWGQDYYGAFWPQRRYAQAVELFDGHGGVPG